MARKHMAVMIMAAVALSSFSLAVAETKKDTELVIDGSTTVGPVADGFAEAFMKKHPEVKITINKTGSGDGAAALIDGRCDIANMSRFLKAKEWKKAIENEVYPVVHVVAMDGVCPIVHPSNPIEGLSRAQIKKIYTGEIKNWKALGGADMAIASISRDSSSGTFGVFNSLIMEKTEMRGDVERVGSNPEMYNRVKDSKGAIGYVGLGFVDDKVKAIKVDGVKPTAKTVGSGQFPVARPLFMVTNGFPKLGSLTHQYVTFYLTEEGQEIVNEKGFVPVTQY